MGDNFFNWPYSQFKYYESNYLLERLFPLPDYLIDADTSVKSRVEGRGGHPRQDSGREVHANPDETVATRIFRKLSCWIRRRNTRTHSGSIQMAQGRKLREGRAANYYISAKVVEWTGQKARYIGNLGLMISKNMH